MYLALNIYLYGDAVEFPDSNVVWWDNKKCYTSCRWEKKMRWNKKKFFSFFILDEEINIYTNNLCKE